MVHTFEFSQIRCMARTSNPILSCLSLGTEYRTVVNNVSGSLNSGLTAVLGPSGAGKTSLLDILTGRKFDHSGLAIDGNVTLNGTIMSPKQLRSVTGYVLQEDLLLSTMT